MRHDRIQAILNNEEYKSCYAVIKECEKDRIFCHHDMSHFLDVARIAQIINFEESIGVDRELIYATALLHDIGRHIQYQTGERHEKASAAIAPRILKECGYDEAEIEVIVDAITNHRNADIAMEPGLRGIIYRGDKASRPCFACEAQSQCDWKESRKNMELKY